jgi:hypothetical protein
MAVKILTDYGSGYESDAAAAIYYAERNGADVTSNSWGGDEDSAVLKEAIDYAHSQGVLTVAAAGNSGSPWPPYPCPYENVIAVAATDSDDKKAGFSNYGGWVDIAAPGVDILSLRASDGWLGYHHDDYTTIMSGTSMACPHVAGVAALVISNYPGASAQEVTARLLETADDISSRNPSYDGLLGRGRLNVYKAVRERFEGSITLDRDFYLCEDIVGVEVLDFDLMGGQTQEVTCSTNGGDQETVVLVRDVDRPWIFRSTIATSADSVVAEDGTLQVAHGRIVTAAYYDADSGEGGPATVEASATIDCEGPVIFNVKVAEITIRGVNSNRAKVIFETDEPSTAIVRCGLACGGPYGISREDATLATSHTFYLTELASDTVYYFVVKATDRVAIETTADNGGSCYSFTTPAIPPAVYVPGEYPTIQSAIDATSNGYRVVLADGTYTGEGNRDINFRRKGIILHSENGPANCTIDCQGTEAEPHRAFTGLGGNSVLEGLTITNSYHDKGAIYCESGPAITGCIITGNRGLYAGGIHCSINSFPTVSHCIITNNSSVHEGGGIKCGASDSHLTLSNCIISDNHAEHGAGILWSSYRGSIIITNCIFIGNVGVAGAGAFGLNSGTGTITNSIFWGNEPIDHQIIVLDPATGRVSYCDVQGGYSGEGNIDADPRFVDAANDDYHLRPDSPCIDTGTNDLANLPPTDFDGIPRPLDGDGDGNAVADMGAYEYWGQQPYIEVTPGEIEFTAVYGGGDPAEQVLTIRNSGAGTLNWQITGDCNWLTVNVNSGSSTGEDDYVILSVDVSGLAEGKYNCELTVSDPNAANSPRTVGVTLSVIAAGVLLVPSEYSTIQAAIDAAIDEDVIVVADGTYSGEGNRDIDFKGRTVTVRSANGPANCVINCQGTPGEPHRGFYFHSGEDAPSVVAGFTIRSGYADYGGGIFNDQSSPTVRNCEFVGNTADMFGGGIENYDSHATIVNCVFSGNSAQEGGGIDNACSSAKLINCTFSGNTAAVSGGGIYNLDSSTTIRNCVLWGDGPEEILVSSGTAAVGYSDVEGGWAGEGNIDVDPRFVDSAGGDYHLSAGSPAIDAGDPGWDWSNEPWPNGGRVNMGAYGNTVEATTTRSSADFEELGQLAGFWLLDHPFIDVAPGPGGDGIVNFLDFSVLAEYWLFEQ